MDWTNPNVCTDEHLIVDDGGTLHLAPWSVPRLVVDVRADSAGDGKLSATISPPGRLLIEAPPITWLNTTPVEHTVVVQLIRCFRSWVTSNPNVIQFRDRFTTGIDREPEVPTVTGISESQAGSGIDVGTNSVAEPKPGRQWVWTGTHCAPDEWVTVLPGERLNVRYRAYVWTPPPFSDNANKNSPQHSASAGYTRLQLIAFPEPGKLVTG